MLRAWKRGESVKMGEMAFSERGEPIARSDEVVISIVELAAVRDRVIGGQLLLTAATKLEGFQNTPPFNTCFSQRPFNQFFKSTYAAHSTAPSMPSPPSSPHPSRPVDQNQRGPAR